MKKANVLFEYIALLSIVIAALSSMSTFLQRRIQGYAKDAIDTKLRRPVWLMWQGSVTWSNSNYAIEHLETHDGNITHLHLSNSTFTSITAPTPQDVVNAALHILDKAKGTKEARFPRIKNLFRRIIL